jgi:ATP-binding cassette subfamily B protein
MSATSSAPHPSWVRFRKLLAYLRPHWQRSSLGIFALLVVNILGVRIPRMIGQAVDELQENFDPAQIWQFVGLILILASVMWCIRMASRMLIFGVGRKVEFDLKQGLFEHLLRLDSGYFSQNQIGDLINRETSDVENIRRLVGFAVLSLTNTLFAYSLTFPEMISINGKISVLIILPYPLMLMIVRLFSDKLRVRQQQVQEELSSLSELIQEDLSGISLIKIYAQEANERGAFRVINDRLLKANLQLAQTRNFLFPLLEGLANVSLLILLVVGAGAIAEGNLLVGDFIALSIYVERLVFPTALLGFTITAYQRGEVSIDRVEAIFKAQPQIQNQPQPLALGIGDVQGKLEAKGLSFTYPEAPTPALAAIDFAIQPGETVAIVGPIGSGKSTLANVLPRLLNVAPGQLFLDGMDVTQISLEVLRQAISYVPQDSFLFSTTIENNIRYGDPLRQAADVERAAKQSQIHPEIVNFPKQYQTLVGERGITLSGGQRQRTALARALLMDQAPILVLDDALSSVDNQTATAILRNLSAGTQRKTVIFISHQLSAAAIADRIWVMDQGKIVQSGTHDQLFEQMGLYRSLWERQQLESNLK